MILCGSEVLGKCESKPVSITKSLCECAAVCGRLCLSAHIGIYAYDGRLRGVLFHAFVNHP